jgi:hypothetical protein
LLIISALPKQWDSAGVAKMETIKHEFQELAGVKQVSLAFEIPDQVPFGKWEVLAPKGTTKDGQITLSLVTADEDYAKTLELKLIAGSFFDGSKEGIILNESAVKGLGEIPMNILGRKIKTIAGDDGITVTGIVKDYNYSSLQDRIAPIGFLHVKTNNRYRYLIVKLVNGPVAKHVEEVKRKWQEMSPHTPFNFSFMDDKFTALYKTELQLQKAARAATGLTLFIVLLGVTGVMALMLRKKIKEISVRKILGAGAFDIILIFLKEYAGMILVANVIAWPCAYITIDRIFEQFTYRTGQTASSYLLSFVLVGGVSLLLVVFQCIRTVVANPVKNLKTDSA